MATSDNLTNPNGPNSSGMAGRAKEIAQRLTPLQKIALGAVLLTVVAGAMVLSKTGGNTSMAALYTDLSSTDAASVVDSLSSRGVEYDLTDAGKTVLVPKDDVYDLRVALAGEGLPTSNEGYALLDNQGITTSEFRQRIDYQRALEGELAKTLTALDDVQSASVHLALPDESLFVDEPATPTASVLVSGKGVGGITGDEVEAIVHLVASSVKDMKPEDVTVIDANGTVLSAAGEGISGGASGSTRAKAVSEYEARVSASIMALLTRMTGPNKVAVTVNAQLDLDESQATSENYEPIGANPSEGQVLTEKTSTEQYGAEVDAANGETGVLGPDGAVIDDSTDTGTAADTDTDYVKDDQERTYALDRIVEQTTNVPGEVLKLNVAVLVDETAVTPEQATAIQQMVSTATGLNPERGDSIVITRLPFDTSASTEADELAAADQKAEAKEQMMGMVRTVAVLLVILIALFLGYRSAKNARKVTATPINIGEIGSSPRGPLVGAGAMPLGTGNAALGGADQTMVMDQVGAGRAPDRDAVVMHELTNMADKRPEEVANVLKAWLAESKVRR
jgi:flagellar M-ring protein FliF